MDDSNTTLRRKQKINEDKGERNKKQERWKLTPFKKTKQANSNKWQRRQTRNKENLREGHGAAPTLVSSSVVLVILFSFEFTFNQLEFISQFCIFRLACRIV